MTRPQQDSTPRKLTPGEQRALASFLSGRLAAGQLDAELARARAAMAHATGQAGSGSGLQAA